jgi:hypothetical protein
MLFSYDNKRQSRRPAEKAAMYWLAILETQSIAPSIQFPFDSYREGEHLMRMH